MTPEGWVRSRIVALATSAGSRIYMLKLPQNPTLPAVRVQRIGNVQEQHLRGPQGTVVTRVQVDAFVSETAADPYSTLADLVEAVKGDGLGPNASGVFGFKGSGGGSPATIEIENVELIHDGTPDYAGDEIKALRNRQDFLVHWRAA